MLYLDDWINHKIKGSSDVASAKTGVLQTDTLSRADLEAWQLQKLRETVEFAIEKSPFYRTRFAEEGINRENCISKIQALKDIEHFPFTTPEDLRESGLQLLCVQQNQISRIVTLDTSGTTGKPKRIYFTEQDQELTIDFFHHGMQLIVDQTDKLLILMPCKRPSSIGDLLRIGLERLGVKTIPYGLVCEYAEYAKLVKLIVDQKITSIVGMPVQVYLLLKNAKIYGANPAIRQTLKSVLLSADYVPGDVCSELSKAWDCKVFEHYGMTEMGLGGAVSCDVVPNGYGYHPREADLYFEIIDPVTGSVVPDGQFGEVVFTTLTRKGMPFIRYRTGDRSRWLTEPCVCGSVLKKLDKVGERAEVKGGYDGSRT